jgi:hypothetical protein
VVTTTEEYRQEDIEHKADVAPGARTTSLPPTQVLVQHATPPFAEPGLDTDHDQDAPLKFCRMANVLGPVAVLGLAVHAP